MKHSLTKLLFFTIIFWPPTCVFGQQVSELISRIKINPGHLYMVTRGTKSKGGLIAQKFNTQDSNISHVGIGFISEGRFKIFHVDNIDPKGNNTCLVTDSIATFIGQPGVYYFAIWKRKVSKHILNRIVAYCNKMKGRMVAFDMSFLLNNGDSLYCSEFCYNALKYASGKKFCTPPVIKDMHNDLSAAILGRKTLSYYPVDFFQAMRGFKKKYEIFFSL